MTRAQTWAACAAWNAAMLVLACLALPDHPQVAACVGFHVVCGAVSTHLAVKFRKRRPSSGIML